MEQKHTDEELFRSLDKGQVRILFWRYKDLTVHSIARQLNVSDTKFYQLQKVIFLTLTGKGGRGEWEKVKKRYDPQLSQLTDEKIKNWKQIPLPLEVKPLPVEKQKEPRKHLNFGIPFFAFLVVIVVIGAYLLGQRGTQSPSQLPPLPTYTSRPTYTLPPTLQPTNTAAVVLINTVMPSFTPTITIIPTDTDIPVTYTPEPTSTPAITLPFSDDFSKGINPPWTIVSGKWVVGNSGATISVKDGDNFTGVIMIDYPALTNYRLRVNVHTPNASIFDFFGQWGVVVRYRSDHDQNIVFYTDDLATSRWGYVPTLINFPSDISAIDDVSKRDYLSDYTLEFDVSGNTFTAKAFGEKYDQIIITGYETGGIALITHCGSVGSCPSFSNFSLEPLP